MHAFTVWSNAPDVETGVVTANLARAHAERGQRVLTIDFTPPGDGLTEYFGLSPADPEAENVVSHLLEEAEESFETLIESAEDGVDIVPTHDHLEGLEETLEQNATLVEMSAPRSDYEYPKTEQLHRVLFDSKVFYEYDMILIDAGPECSQHAYNAVYAAPNVLIPFTTRSQLEASEAGLEDIESTLEEIDVSVIGAVPSMRAEPDDSDDLPTELPITDVSIPDAPSLFEDARVANASVVAFDADDQYRSLTGDETEVLEAFDELADRVTTSFENY